MSAKSSYLRRRVQSNMINRSETFTVLSWFRLQFRSVAYICNDTHAEVVWLTAVRRCTRPSTFVYEH